MSSIIGPMFSYFGSRFRVSKLYPEPKFKTIVEPFAGAAGYSTYWNDEHTVELSDSYGVIAETWAYLLNATADDILSIPIGPYLKGKREIAKELAEFPLGARYLVGFWETQSQAYPSGWQQSPEVNGKGKKGYGGKWNMSTRERVAHQLSSMGRWSIKQADAFNVLEAETEGGKTYFIDPPFQKGGERYKHSNKGFDYERLAEGCKRVYSLGNQVIVCERDPALWITQHLGELEHLCDINNASNKLYSEVYWHC